MRSWSPCRQNLHMPSKAHLVYCCMQIGSKNRSTKVQSRYEFLESINSRQYLSNGTQCIKIKVMRILRIHEDQDRRQAFIWARLDTPLLAICRIPYLVIVPGIFFYTSSFHCCSYTLLSFCPKVFCSSFFFLVSSFKLPLAVVPEHPLHMYIPRQIFFRLRM